MPVKSPFGGRRTGDLRRILHRRVAFCCFLLGSGRIGGYDGGLVSYANSVKHRLLSVEESVLSTFGPVSEQCCAQMAKGACALFSAQLGLAVTGFAGPGGGTPEKPVGTVYIGACHKGELLVKRYLFSGDRQAVRRQAANAALRLGLEVLSAE